MCAGVLVGALLAPVAAHARSHGGGHDGFAAATSALVSDPSEKVRVQAALVLGRAGDPRATPFLLRALEDPSAPVRAMAARSLGELGDGAARGPLRTLSIDDPSALVREHASAALELIASGGGGSTLAASADVQGAAPAQSMHGAQAQASALQTSLDVRAVGDLTHHAPSELRARMRDIVASELAGQGTLRGGGAGGYSVDGAIKVLKTTDLGDHVEVSCAVQLVLSHRRGHSIVMMSSGEATVHKTRRQFRPVMEPSMQIEAMEHAVRGASEELKQHFAAN